MHYIDAHWMVPYLHRRSTLEDVVSKIINLISPNLAITVSLFIAYQSYYIHDYNWWEFSTDKTNITTYREDQTHVDNIHQLQAA